MAFFDFSHYFCFHFQDVNAQTAPSVSWYYLGSARSNYSLTVNTGSALVLGCLAKAVNDKAAATVLISPLFILTKGSSAVPSITAATSATKPMALSSSGGTLLWDSINGNAAGYDHILAITSLPLTNAASPASGFVQMYIPSLVSSDAGLYYCTFFDGSTATVAATNYGNSGYFSLTMTTKSGSGSSKSAQRNKALEYTMVLLGASKMLL